MFTVGQQVYVPGDCQHPVLYGDQFFIVRSATQVDEAWEYELGGLDGGPQTVTVRFDGDGKLLPWTPSSAAANDRKTE